MNILQDLTGNIVVTGYELAKYRILQNITKVPTMGLLRKAFPVFSNYRLSFSNVIGKAKCSQ